MTGRVLALDVGERRIGVAVCDASRVLASPYTTLHATPSAVFFKKIQAILAAESIVHIVVGLPISLNGHEGPQAQRIRQFIDTLAQHTALPITTCDERYTSAAAERLMLEAGLRPEQRKARIDEVAASIILQDWLDAQRPSRLSDYDDAS